jgi:hypothetical protein
VDECDLAEYCPGGTDDGPKDGYLYPGKTCTREGYSGLVYGGRCESLTHYAQVTSTVTLMETGTWRRSAPASSILAARSSATTRTRQRCTQAQSFTTHGKRSRAADGQLCWLPNTAMGARIGQCSRDECKLPGQLTSAPVCGNGGIDLERSVIVAPRPATPASMCSTCRLKAHKQCSRANACCDNACMLKAAGMVCRAAVTAATCRRHAVATPASALPTTASSGARRARQPTEGP